MKAERVFRGKNVWISGASSGIGEALVYELSALGARLIISSNDLAGLQRVEATCVDRYNVSPLVQSLDLSNTEGVNDIVSDVIKQVGHIDFLFNIAGISQRARIEETPLWVDRKIFEINYFGTISLTKAVLPYMIERKSGYIVATSSITGRFGFPLRSSYSASKQAIHGFFETLFLENKSNNIRTSVLIPGRVRTNISLHALEKDGTEHGKLDDGQANGITPERAAKIIVRGILRDKREILVGSKELLLLRIRRLCPPLFFKIADKVKST